MLFDWNSLWRTFSYADIKGGAYEQDKSFQVLMIDGHELFVNLPNGKEE